MNNELATINHKNVNLSMFIVPNSGVNEKYRLDFLRDNDIAECERIGIPLKGDEDVFQVWIHCPELGIDNCTDHGLGKEIRKRLGLGEEERLCSAPGYVPFSQFEGKKEGETVTFTSPNGTIVNVKLEQLPYRYGRFGSFEEVFQKMKYATKRNNEWYEEMKNK